MRGDLKGIYLSLVFIPLLLIESGDAQGNCEFDLLGNGQYNLHMELVDDIVNFTVGVSRSNSNDFWIGFGISPGNDMAGADIFIIRVINDTLKRSDYYATENGRPIEDDITDNNWKLVGSYYISDTWINFTAEKPVNVSDPQDISIEDKDLYLIWALGGFQGDGGIGYDGKTRGHRFFNLFQQKCEPDPSDAVTVLFRPYILIMTLIPLFVYCFE